MVQGYNDTMIQWYNGTMIQWYNGTMIQWYNGVMIQWYNVTPNKIREKYFWTVKSFFEHEILHYSNILQQTAIH